MLWGRKVCVLFFRAGKAIRCLTLFLVKSASREHITHAPESSSGNAMRYNLKVIVPKAARSLFAPLTCFET